MKVGIRCVYEAPGVNEGLRVFVDRLWPRGMRKDQLEYDLWEKGVAPSPELRKWFGHDPCRWNAFRERYLAELELPGTREHLFRIVKMAAGRPITLLYGARDPRHNHALILAEVLAGLY